MRKRVFCVLLAVLMLLLSSCAVHGADTRYETEHEHVYGFWYERAEGGRERYCKICFEMQVE